MEQKARDLLTESDTHFEDRSTGDGEQLVHHLWMPLYAVTGRKHYSLSVEFSPWKIWIPVDEIGWHCSADSFEVFTSVT